MNLLTLLRVLHIASGVVALAVVAVPLLARKGGRLHRGAGRVFAWAMGVIAVTAVPLGIARAMRQLPAGLFLLQISALSGASTWLGRRVLRAKGPPRGQRFTPERLAAAALLLCSAAFAAFGITERSGLHVAFAALGIVQGAQWLRFFGDARRDAHAWLPMHVNGMGTAAIAAITAFAVINTRRIAIPPGLAWLAWVVPGIAGGAAIAFWTARYRRRLRAA